MPNNLITINKILQPLQYTVWSLHLKKLISYLALNYKVKSKQLTIKTFKLQNYRLIYNIISSTLIETLFI